MSDPTSGDVDFELASRGGVKVQSSNPVQDVTGDVDENIRPSSNPGNTSSNRERAAHLGHRFSGVAWGLRGRFVTSLSLSIIGDTRPQRLERPLLSGSTDSPGTEDQGQQEIVELARDCYSLLLLTGGCNIMLLLMVIVGVGQFAVLLIIGWSSPEYVFQNHWIVPISTYPHVNLMKAFSIIIMFFRMSKEFEDCLKLFRVLAHVPSVPFLRQQRVAGYGAFALQYCVAVMVFIMASHLILSATTAMSTLVNVFAVFMVLEFDDLLCNFAIFVLDLEDKLVWKVPLYFPSVTDATTARAQERPGFIRIFAFPCLLNTVVIMLSLWFNVCPLTFLHYGHVSNTNPIIMLGPTLGILDGCCPPVFKTEELQDPDHAHSFLISVPCFSPTDASASQGRSAFPIVYFVIVEEGQPEPSSLQTLEGKSGDGNIAIRFGRAVARPVQLRAWMKRHQFDTAYDYLLKRGANNFGLYETNFPFLAEWVVPDMPQNLNGIIYATAENPVTKALSLKPVKSKAIIRRQCVDACVRCNDIGHCEKCHPGFVLGKSSKKCLRCAPACQHCNTAGSGLCDPGKCHKGYGLSVDKLCLECVSRTTCQRCDADDAESMVASLNDRYNDDGGNVRDASWLNTTNRDRSLPASAVRSPFQDGVAGFSLPNWASSTSGPPSESLACKSCREGFGLAVNGSCVPCTLPNCRICRGVKTCEDCQPGFMLRGQQPGEAGNTSREATVACVRCPDNCLKCNKNGPSLCDAGQCKASFGMTSNGTCQRCPAFCSHCNIQGANQCDFRGCFLKYGLQGRNQCSRCEADHCKHCDRSMDRCDECSDGFGQTVDGRCLSCPLYCRSCTHAKSCLSCKDGFGLAKGHCHACADQCMRCNSAGEGRCDKDHCVDGWKTVPVRGVDKNGFTCVRNHTETASEGSWRSATRANAQLV